MSRNPRIHPLHKLRPTDFSSLLKHHVSPRIFLSLNRNTHDADVGYILMFHQHSLQFRRRDLISFHFNEFLLPIHDVEMPRLINITYITGLQPAIRRQRLPRRLLIPPIPLHDIRRADPQLASLPNSHFPLPTLIHNLRLAIRQQFPHTRTRADVIRMPAHRRARRFRHAPSLLQIHLSGREQRVYFARHGVSKRCRAAAGVADGRQVVGFYGGVFGERDGDGGREG
jgi:hypothetical protein